MAEKLEIVLMDASPSGGGSVATAPAPQPTPGAAASAPTAPAAPSAAGAPTSPGATAPATAGASVAASVAASAPAAPTQATAAKATTGTAPAPAASPAAPAAKAPKADKSAEPFSVSALAKGADQIGSAVGAGAFTGPIAAIATAAGPVAVFAAVVGAAALAVKGFTSVMDGEVNKLKGYSGPLAAATAMSDVRSQMSTIERGEKLGPQLARYEDLRSRWQERMSDLWTKILESLLNLLEKLFPILERIIAIAEIGPTFVEWVQANGEILIDILSFDVNERNRDMARANALATQIGAALLRLTDALDRDDDFSDPLAEMFRRSIEPIRNDRFGDPRFGPVVPPRVPPRAPEGA